MLGYHGGMNTTVTPEAPQSKGRQNHNKESGQERGLPRWVGVPLHGPALVPRNIYRIDSATRQRKKNGKWTTGGWHGWQVRWSAGPGHPSSKKVTKFFSDSRHGGVLPALDAAAAHLESCYAGKRSQCRTDAGIRVVHILNKRDFEEVYVEASHPEYGRSPRRFYVGTANTATEERLQMQIQKARIYREDAVRQHNVKYGLVT